MWFVHTTPLITYKDAGAFGKLLQQCKQHADNTRLLPVTEVAYLILNGEGVTNRGLKWEAVAFHQLCDLLAGGLFTLLSTVWKESGHMALDERKKHFLKIYHNVLFMLYKNVDGVRLVTDMSTKIVVGVVGRKYKYVSNFELLSMIKRNFDGDGNFQAYYGQLRNRDICLLAVCKPVVKKLDGVSFRQGVGLFNSETTRQAIYVPRLVFDSISGTYSQQPATADNRLIHRSKKGFAETLDSVVTSAYVDKDQLDDVASGFSVCNSRRLWTDSEHRTKVILALVESLRDREVGVIGLNSVRSMLESRKVASLWDLYQSMVCTAAAGRSERSLRVCAFKLLITGSLK